MDPHGRWAPLITENAVTAKEAATTHISLVLNEPSAGLAAPDYEWDSVMAEYLDDAEISELTVAARDAGFAVSTFDGERAFIAAVLRGEWKRIPFEKKYVFNTTGSGMGRARTSLVPAFCDLQGIPLCSADGLTAAFLESKITTFRVLAGLGFQTPRTWIFRQNGWDGDAPSAGTKVICKPAHECSSIGINADAVFAYDDARIPFLTDMGRVYRQPVVVQEFIHGYEIEVPVFPCPAPCCPAAVGISIEGTELLDGGIIDNRMVIEGSYGFYDFDARDPGLGAELRATAERAYTRLGFTGLVRVDFRVTEDRRFYISDFSTPPHVTHHSSCRFAFTNAGFAHKDLMLALVTAGRSQRFRQ